MEQGAALASWAAPTSSAGLVRARERGSADEQCRLGAGMRAEGERGSHRREKK